MSPARNGFPSPVDRRYRFRTPRMETDPAETLADDVALLRRVAQGDRRGLEELYDRFANLLFTVAHRVLNDQQATEDVLQDVFVQIWEKAPLYDVSRGKPLTWAITLTRNKAIDQLRAIQRRGRLAESAEREYKASRISKGRAPSMKSRPAKRAGMCERLSVSLAREPRSDRAGLLFVAYPGRNRRAPPAAPWHREGADSPCPLEASRDPRLQD